MLAADGEGRWSSAARQLEGESLRLDDRECPQVHLFEREIAEQWGVVPRAIPG